MSYLLSSGFMINPSRTVLTDLKTNFYDDSLLTEIIRATHIDKKNIGLYSKNVEDIYAKSINNKLRLDRMDDIDEIINVFNNLFYYDIVSSWIRLQYRSLQLSVLQDSFLKDAIKVIYNGCPHTDLGKYIGLLRPCIDGSNYTLDDKEIRVDNDTVLQNVLVLNTEMQPNKGLFELINFMKVVFGNHS
jgi:hypothetical protein